MKAMTQMENVVMNMVRCDRQTANLVANAVLDIDRTTNEEPVNEVCFADFLRTMMNDDGERRAVWVSKLREKGVKGAHPDDGWVNRKLKYVVFNYPQFNDGVKIGDLIALGDYDECRLVKVIKIESNKLCGRGGLDRYYFGRP